MKTILSILAILILSPMSMAQSGINYKAVIKDGSGSILVNTVIDVDFIILDGSSPVYKEKHSQTTDGNGIIFLNIGEGIPLSGIFADIDWSNMNHFLNVSVDTGSGSQDMGTTAFQTVPYAKIAADVENTIWNENIGGDINYTDGRVGVGLALLENTFSVVQSTSSDNVVRFQSDNHVNFQDLLELILPSDATSNMQFIEMQAGTNIVARVNGDGSAKFKSIQFGDFSTQTTAAFSPVAYGFVLSTGSITSGSGNFSCTWNSIFSAYEISITGVTYFYQDFTTNVTAASGLIYRTSVNSSTGNMLVFLYDSSGNRIQGEFQFSTFQ